MSRITINNLAGVATLSQNEMAATEGGLLFPPRRRICIRWVRLGRFRICVRWLYLPWPFPRPRPLPGPLAV